MSNGGCFNAYEKYLKAQAQGKSPVGANDKKFSETQNSNLLCVDSGENMVGVQQMVFCEMAIHLLKTKVGLLNISFSPGTLCSC